MVPRQQRLKRSFCGLGADPEQISFRNLTGQVFFSGFPAYRQAGFAVFIGAAIKVTGERIF